MKIALVGYGKMGHMLEQSALSLGHSVVSTIDVFAPDAKVKISSKVPIPPGRAMAMSL